MSYFAAAATASNFLRRPTAQGFPSGITPDLNAEFFESGSRQNPTIGAGGTISGVAPFLVTFDASGTRSESASTLAAAYQDMGYSMDYGEGLAGTWPYSGQSRNIDHHCAPIFHRAFTEVGTHTVRMRCTDGTREATLSFTVVVSAPPTPTHIPVSAGAWPTWVDGAHYTLDRGGNYSSFGNLTFNGRRDIVISAVGSGAAPIVGTVIMDTRNTVDSTFTRPSNIRLWGVDVANWIENTTGHDYCGVIGGRLRQFTTGIFDFVWDNDVNTAAKAASVRFSRGTFWWDCGEVNVAGNDYVYIGGASRLAIVGCDLHRQSGTGGGHVLRGDFAYSSVRHNRFRVSTGTTTYIKLTARPGFGSPVNWPSNDAFGDWDAGAKPKTQCATQIVAIDHNIFGAASDSSTIGVGITPENNIGASGLDALELVSFENNAFYRASGGNNISLGGRNLSGRSNRFDSGSGALVTCGTSVFPNRIPPGWDGPYLTEAANARPVPTTF